MVLVSHVILQDDVITGSCDFVGRSLKWRVTSLPSLVVIDTGRGDIMILVCLMISQDHVIKGSCDFMPWSPSK